MLTIVTLSCDCAASTARDGVLIASRAAWDLAPYLSEREKEIARAHTRAHGWSGWGEECMAEGEGEADSPLSMEPNGGLIPGPQYHDLRQGQMLN